MRVRLVYAMLLMVLPTGVVALVVIILMLWRVPTHVQMSLTVSRAEFTIGETTSPSVRILDPLEVHSVTFEKFSRVVFEPTELEVADWAQYDFEEDRFQSSAWRPLPLETGPVSVVPNDGRRHSRVTIEGAENGLTESRGLDQIRVRQGSVVTLEVTGGPSYTLTLKIAGGEPRVLVSSLGVFQIITEQARIAGLAEGVIEREGSLNYRAQLRHTNPFVEVKGSSGVLVLSVRLPAAEKIRLFTKGSIPVSAIDFTRQDDSGNRVSALVRGERGQFNFPDYPQLGKRSLTAPDFVGLDELAKSRIREISLMQAGRGMQLEFEGTADHLRIGNADFPTDHRLTAFATLWHSENLVILASVAVWIFVTTVGGYRLYKELRG